MKYLRLLMERLPYLEIFIRKVYWRSELLNRLISNFKNKNRNKKKRLKSQTISKNRATKIHDIKDLVNALKNHGLRPGDILILHSSFSAIGKFESDPMVTLDALTEFLGPEGTLVIPTFPVYPDGPQGTQRVTQDMSDVVLTYDIVKSRPWTGVLASAILEYDGAVRSAFPLNTVCAVGGEAQAMFESELTTPLETPNGRNSAWAYCGERDALIVTFGVDLTHNLTMIHTAEDCHEDSWPVPNWYRKRKFKVVFRNRSEHITIRERHPKWAAHYGERKLSFDLRRKGLAKTSELNGVQITSIRSNALLNFLDSNRDSGYPYFLWKYFS